jgi:hypothetical protein
MTAERWAGVSPTIDLLTTYWRIAGLSHNNPDTTDDGLSNSLHPPMGDFEVHIIQFVVLTTEALVEGFKKLYGIDILRLRRRIIADFRNRGRKNINARRRKLILRDNSTS